MARGDLVLMGPPGSGKGTQAQGLVRVRGWVQLSTGDLFREHIKRDTLVGRAAKQFIDRGEYVPDLVTVDMVRQRIASIPRDTRIVFDGFPRTVAQAHDLEGLLKEFDRGLDAVLLLEVPRAELLARLGKRARDQGRTDDTPEVIGRRLDVYEQQTGPVVEGYKTRHIVRLVDGVGTVDQIAARLADAAAG